MSDKIELYFYNGMQAPEKIDVDDLVIESSYLGDITDNFISEYKEMLEFYTLDDMIENQPLTKFNIYVNPTKEFFQDYNKSLTLDKNQYLDEFEPVY